MHAVLICLLLSIVREFLQHFAQQLFLVIIYAGGGTELEVHFL